MSGWNLSDNDELMGVLSDIYSLEYEIKNCVRGCYTGAHTYEELADKIRELGEALADAADSVRYTQEDEEDEDDE